MTKPIFAMEPTSDQELALAERRRAARFASDLETACHPVSGGGETAWAARVRNISRTGIALALSRRFERGTLLSVQLEHQGGTGARTVLARVVHVRAEEHGSWVMGCAFASELEDDDLKPFQAERRRPAEPDCRAWVRFDCDVPAAAWVLRAGRAEPLSVRVVNISPGGMALLVPDAIETGTFLRLELPGTEGGSAEMVEVRVIQAVSRDNEGWVLGCELAGQIGADELEDLSDGTLD